MKRRTDGPASGVAVAIQGAGPESVLALLLRLEIGADLAVGTAPGVCDQPSDRVDHNHDEANRGQGTGDDVGPSPETPDHRDQ